MKSICKSLCLFLTLIMVFSLCACTNFFGNSQASQESTRKSFDALTEEIFTKTVTTDALTLHYTISYPENYGITDYPLTIGSYSDKNFTDSYAEMNDWFTQLKDLNSKLLTSDQQLTYKILYRYFSIELSASDLYLYYEPLSSVYGDQLNIPILFAEYAFNTQKDIDDYIALLGTVDTYCQDIIDFETRKSEAGLFMADFSAENIIKQCEDFIATPDDNYLIELFDSKIDSFSGLTDEQKAAYKESNKQLVLNDVVSAYNILINGLKSLEGTGKNQGGICNLDKGKDYFEYIVKSEVGSEKSVEQIKSLIQDKMNQDIDEISTLSNANPNIFDEMDATSLTTTDYQGTLENLSKLMLIDFPAGPDITYTVKTVHPSMKDSLSPAFYLTPTIDKYDSNVIYVNGETDIQTLAHEGYPGHMYQNTYFASTHPANIRFLMDITGYSEGWATYVEFYSYHLSGLDEDLATAMEANMSYTLGIYSLVDIGVNYEGWTRQDTYDYLDSIGISTPSDQKEIFEIMIGSPGNYLNYYVGYLEILQLKNEAETKKGSAFNLKDFNTFLLETGPASFDVLKDEMEDWAKN